MSGKLLTILALEEARVFKAESLPDAAVLALQADGETRFYAMSVEDLAGLAERLRRDALLLQ